MSPPHPVSPAAPNLRSGLPPRTDPAWHRAPSRHDGAPTAYLPLHAPYVPDLAGRLGWLRASTRLVLLEDGYPARLVNGRVVVHPMDGRYLLEALLSEQMARPRRRLGAYIARTAHAIVGRAEVLEDAFVLRYFDTASSMVEGRPHISGLPQAYYAAALARAGRFLNDAALTQAADRFFAALLIPVSDGGALYRSGRDTALATVPSRPRDLVLNGWLSMLVALHHYATERDSDGARALFSANVRTLRRLLPLYDIPELRLSRYGLTGPILLRLRLSSRESSVRLTRLRLAIPGEGENIIPVIAGGRWTQRIPPEDADLLAASGAGREVVVPRSESLRLNVVMSRAPYPRPNRLRFGLRSGSPISVVTEAHIGRYDPMASATVDRAWVRLDDRRVGPGRRSVDIPLPYEPVDLFAYPTNFTRGAPGVRANTYHGTHIVRLRQLAEITRIREFRELADRWHAYVRDWASMPELSDGVCWTPEGPL